jgi:hypothetical protein
LELRAQQGRLYSQDLVHGRFKRKSLFEYQDLTLSSSPEGAFLENLVRIALASGEDLKSSELHLFATVDTNATPQPLTAKTEYLHNRVPAQQCLFALERKLRESTSVQGDIWAL